MATVLLGRTSAGTTGDFNGAGHAAVWRFQATASGRAATFFGNTKVANPTGTVTIGAYVDGAGPLPTTRIAGPTAAGAGANGSGQWSVDISSWAWDIVSGTFYWIGWRNSAEQYEFQGDSVAATYTESSGTADFQDPWGATSAGGTTAILWIEDADTTSPSAIPDFQRKAFPFLIGDGRMQGVSRSAARWRVGGRSGPSPIGGWERFIFPRLHPDYGVGGVTYDKLGALIAGMVAAGDDVFEATEAGSLTPDTTAAGADVFEHVESGAFVAGTIFAGADVFTAAETGSLTPAAFLAGVGSKAAEKTGSLIVGVFTAGADVFTAAETGTISTRAIPAGADVFEHNETGSLNPAAQLRGADSFQPAETGALTPTGFIAGPDASTFNRLGSVTTGALLSGVEQKLGSYLKTGSFTVGAVLAGADQATVNRLGSITPDTTLSGGKIREKTKTGSNTAGTQLRGADSFNAVETGSLTPATFILGGRVATLNRSGSLTIGTLVGGTSSYVSGAALPPVPILTGWIATPNQGGRIGGGVRGQIRQPVTGEVT
jgi:ferritin-like metal-binding protein YciE